MFAIDSKAIQFLVRKPVSKLILSKVYLDKSLYIKCVNIMFVCLTMSVCDNDFLQNKYGSGGIRTHASEGTGALNQRRRPLGHATSYIAIGM